MIESHSQAANRLQGPLAPVMTPFDPNDGLDVQSLAGWIDWMAQRGVPVMWTTGGTSEMVSLTEAEIFTLTRTVGEANRGRIFYIASTGPTWPVPKCIEFVKFAEGCGADAVKVLINWLGGPSDDDVLDFYRRVAASTDLPLVAYTLGQPGMSVDSLMRLIEKVPQVIAIKNDTDDQYRHSAYLTAVPEGFAVITGGMQRPFLTGHLFGQRCYADSFAMFKPELALQFHALVEAGEREQAAEHIRRYEMCVSDLTVFGRHRLDSKALGKTILWLTGHFATNRVRFPRRTLPAGGSQVQAVREVLEEIGVDVVR